MKSDTKVKRMKKAMAKGRTLIEAASEGEMCTKTARKYLRQDKLPSQLPKKVREHKTRQNPFDFVWYEIEGWIENNPRLEAKTIFEYLHRKYPDRFQDGQLRTLQRRIKIWRAQCGPAKEVFFEQSYNPGERAQVDFTRMNSLNVTIAGQTLQHMLFHFNLCYGNWESAMLCFSESFESLSDGLQTALSQLGYKPKIVQTDSLSAAIRISNNSEEFTQRYRELMDDYRLEYQNTNSGRGNENGKVEKSHDLLKKAVDQALMLRGSRDFPDRET